MYLILYIRTYIQTAKQGCDFDGERVQSYRSLFLFSFFFFHFCFPPPPHLWGSRCSWMNTSLQDEQSSRLDCSIENLFSSRGHDSILLLHVSYEVQDVAGKVTLEEKCSVPGPAGKLVYDCGTA